MPIPEEVIEVESVQLEEPIRGAEFEEEVIMEKELSPIEQLRLLSREELERRLQEHFQHQFLEELRSELNRRNLIEPEVVPDSSNEPVALGVDYDLQTEHVF